MRVHFTPDDWRDIDALLEKGTSHKEIAEIYDCHEVTVSRHAASVPNRKNKVKMKLDPSVKAEILARHQQGEHKKAISEAVGVHWSTVYREIRKFEKLGKEAAEKESSSEANQPG